MGQIFSLRKNRSKAKKDVDNNKLRKSASDIPVSLSVVDYGKTEGVDRKSPSSERLVQSRTIKQGTLNASAKSGASRDSNNNCQFLLSTSLVEHVTKDSVNKSVSKANRDVFDGRDEGVSIRQQFKNTPTTYENNGHKHPSYPKSSLRTTQTRTATTCLHKNYYLDTSKSIYSEPTVQSEPARRHRHHHQRHHHRRRKSKSNVQQHDHQHFGYDIRNVEEFLTKCSLLSPANIPVVLSQASILYQTRPGFQSEIPLPLGMVVNGVFKIQQWLYVQTPHAEEGYINYSSCLPLGILPTTRPTSSRSKPERCWETTEDIYRRPGLWTDSDQEYHNRSTRSEGVRTPNCSEKNVDSLYLKAAASQTNIEKTYSQVKRKSPVESENHTSSTTLHTHSNYTPSPLIRETLLAVQINYKSAAISVKKGDVVVLLACKEIRDNHSKTPRQWFYIRTRDRVEAFIPAEVAGHGYL